MTVINTGNQSIAGHPFNTAYSASASDIAGKAAGTGMISSGVISGLADIATGYINAQRIKQSYNFQAELAKLQNRLVRLQADIQIKNIRKKAQSLWSTQRAGYANAGFSLEGSPMAVMMNSAKEAELDAIYTDISAQYNIGVGQSQADIYKASGQSATTDAFLNSMKTILTMADKQYTRG